MTGRGRAGRRRAARHGSDRGGSCVCETDRTLRDAANGEDRTTEGEEHRTAVARDRDLRMIPLDAPLLEMITEGPIPDPQGGTRAQRVATEHVPVPPTHDPDASKAFVQRVREACLSLMREVVNQAVVVGHVEAEGEGSRACVNFWASEGGYVVELCVPGTDGEQRFATLVPLPHGAATIVSALALEARGITTVWGCATTVPDPRVSSWRTPPPPHTWIIHTCPDCPHGVPTELLGPRVSFPLSWDDFRSEVARCIADSVVDSTEFLASSIEDALGRRPDIPLA